MTLNVLFLQHVPFEGPGAIADFLSARGHHCQTVPLFDGASLPAVAEVDWVVVMGGPMGIHDEDQYPFLAAEKRFIKSCVDGGKTVLGICLGAQLLADQMGGQVVKNGYREIGWFDVQRSIELGQTIFQKVFPSSFPAFHWHGDTFSIPDKAIPVGSTLACQNQGFVFENRVVALQFHLETVFASALLLVENCADELDGSIYVQSRDTILSSDAPYKEINRLMEALLLELGA